MTQQPKQSLAEKLVVRIPYVWLLVFFLLPLLILFRISVSHSAQSQPPYAPFFILSLDWHGVSAFFGALSFGNYAIVISDPSYLLSFVKSIEVAAFSTLLLLVIGYPIAYGIARTPRHIRAVLMTLIVLPLWISVLIRGYALVTILQHAGPSWLGTDTAVFIGIVYAYLPLMVLPLYTTLRKLDETLLEAAADLGCPRWKIFWDITLPLSAPGVLTGALLCFVPAVGAFVIPDLLGNAQAPMIGQTIWAAFFGNKDWPTAAALATVLVGFLIAPIVILQHQAIRAAGRD